jgi:O-acetyl-ADP-ribose deacetylase (regulator of RNase III)
MTQRVVGQTVIELVQGDITKSETAAIANAANAMLMGGGGVDGAICRAAGPELLEALREVKRGLSGGVLPTGSAVMTPGFRLFARFVIHCVGPIYSREGAQAPKLLRSCYSQALALCREHDLESIAFPSISTGVYGYPIELAAPVALRAVADGLRLGPLPRLCRFVLFDEATLSAYRAALADLPE